MEKIICEMVISDMKNSLDPSQYGNQKHLSIQHYLVRLLHRIVSNKTQVESVQLGITLDLKFPPSPRDRVKCSDLVGGWGEWVCVLFLSFNEANIPNLSLLLCLEPFQKFLVVGWWGVVGWLRPILVFSLSLSQAEQYKIMNEMGRG